MKEDKMHNEWYYDYIDRVNAWREILSRKKGAMYSGDDKISNFKRAAKRHNLDVKTIIDIYASKHWDAIGNLLEALREGAAVPGYVNKLFGSLDDLRNYLDILDATAYMMAEEDVKDARRETIGVDGSQRTDPETLSDGGDQAGE